MIPRKRLDLDWADLWFGMRGCLWPAGRGEVLERLESSWSADANVACLSVRSGFDALLSVLDWPPGSEVLVSAVTIRDMTRLLGEHGLTPVPIDVDFETLAVDADSLARATTPQTKGILVAHLFGSRPPLGALADFARQHDLLLIEDCAQAFTGDAYRGHLAADVSMFSFGPIKTATALGGGLLRVRDSTLAEQTRTHMERWPVQTHGQFLTRLMKYGLLHALSYRTTYTAFTTACRLLGVDHDRLINRSVRSFAGNDFLVRIRRRPCAALLALIERRIGQNVRARIDRRREIGERLASVVAANLGSENAVPGLLATEHSYWVFPMLCEEPELWMQRLAAQGFDATRGASSLYVVEPPAGSSQLCAAVAKQAFARLLYLPIDPGMSERDIARLAGAIRKVSDELSPKRKRLKQITRSARGLTTAGTATKWRD